MTEKVEPQVRQMVATLATGDVPMVRASLLKNNALMRSLGRPMREQIVSMRPSELTTLEAIDLANEAELSRAFAEGGKVLVDRFDGDSARIIDYVYDFALAREPSKAERAILGETLGPKAAPEAVQDALWAICMLPEFWLVQ